MNISTRPEIAVTLLFIPRTQGAQGQEKAWIRGLRLAEISRASVERDNKSFVVDSA